jgi:hypothetical protein
MSIKKDHPRVYPLEGVKRGAFCSNARVLEKSVSRRIGAWNPSVQGAVSFCDEHDVHLFLRR